jgi:hypothetical protein
MLMNTIQTGAKKVGDGIVRNSPTIMTGLGVGGMLTTIFLAVKATPKALRHIDDVRDQHERDAIVEGYEYEPPTTMEIVKASWKDYLPAALTGLSAVACLVFANTVSLQRQAALVSLYTMAEATLVEYKDKVIETIGANKEEKVHEAILQDRIDRAPLREGAIIVGEKGDTLCFDSLSGRYFKSDIEIIRRVQNDFNAQLINERYLTLNEFYDLLGLEHMAMGISQGWSTEYGLLDISFSAKMKDGKPCMVLDFRVGPRPL